MNAANKKYLELVAKKSELALKIKQASDALESLKNESNRLDNELYKENFELKKQWYVGRLINDIRYEIERAALEIRAEAHASSDYNFTDEMKEQVRAGLPEFSDRLEFSELRSGSTYIRYEFVTSTTEE